MLDLIKQDIRVQCLLNLGNLFDCTRIDLVDSISINEPN